MATPLSILDLAFVAPAQSTRDALLESVALAQKAEETGRFERIWFAEHHNMRTIASAATSVLIGHVASATSTIRVGAGGVMLPNHSPLVIAEQFGTLAELHPGRIDLGLGRAPGTDQETLRALRRDPRASDQFPQDVQELQGYLSQDTLVPGIHAYPGWGTQVPLYILGSSLFGAQLAAALGLPYSFASHFAPDALEQAVQVYRDRFQPSEQLAEPYVIAALNVIAADDTATAEEQARLVRRQRLRTRAGRRGTELTEEQVDEAMGTAFGQQVQHMMRWTAVGDGAEVARYLAEFRDHAQADELMVTNATQGLDARLRALEIIATVP
ncbi:LLM class flavin-dependent oxidoreductase [uncultured Arsenicicoccus sp.]|uniref:LLM class flavin-dependent oxidoreductase n=1 Tax=uncultured Arsenicicoccus sp. TaxID=491339 RepID=UPI002592FBA9|nr:LLM class flavin-dependent oxidoreductase [uncultured Arsenicicoccus sp.]